MILSSPDLYSFPDILMSFLSISNMGGFPTGISAISLTAHSVLASPIYEEILIELLRSSMPSDPSKSLVIYCSSCSVTLAERLTMAFTLTFLLFNISYSICSISHLTLHCIPCLVSGMSMGYWNPVAVVMLFIGWSGLSEIYSILYLTVPLISTFPAAVSAPLTQASPSNSNIRAMSGLISGTIISFSTTACVESSPMGLLSLMGSFINSKDI